MTEYSDDDAALLDALGGIELDTAAVERVPEQFEEPTEQLAASPEQVHDLAKQDLDFLAALIMPTVFAYCFPAVYKEGVWAWLLSYVHQNRTFPQLALGLPRGFAKSTVLKIFLVYCILFTNRKFI